MFSRMFKPSKEKAPAADAKGNAPVANGHEKADLVADADAEPMETDGAATGDGAIEAENVSAAAIK